MAKEVSIEEGAVKVVRCSVTNEPMQNVPGWYSEVKVRFVSDKGRKTTDVHADVLPPDEPVVKPVDEEEGDISLDELQDEEEAGEDRCRRRHVRRRRDGHHRGRQSPSLFLAWDRPGSCHR